VPELKPDPWIVCAANRFDDIIVCGARHYDSAMMSSIDRHREHGLCLKYECEQGFIDQFGKFYTREEAWKIAEKNGQIKRRVGGDTINGGKLFSENLY